MKKFILAFDIYGTLLDTSSISRALSEHLQLDKAKTSDVSNLWRRYQLEYTWRLNSMNIYEPFDIVTQKSLRHALKESGISFAEETVKGLMDSYDVLPCFPNTIPALQKLAQNSDVKIVVFSNGTASMVQTALDAAGISKFASEIYVADNVRRYKPSPEIYNGLLSAVGKTDHPKECFLVSGNPFDVTGALSSGMRAIWVDRAQRGWMDTLLPVRDASELEPMKIVHDLEEIPGLVASLE